MDAHILNAAARQTQPETVAEATITIDRSSNEKTCPKGRSLATSLTGNGKWPRRGVTNETPQNVG